MRPTISTALIGPPFTKTLGIMDSALPEYIAERVVALAPALGQRRLVSLKVGRPRRTTAGSWACQVVADGLHSNLAPIHGEDSWQALLLAQQFLLSLLKTEVEKGTQLLWPDEPVPMSLDQLFCVAAP